VAGGLTRGDASSQPNARQRSQPSFDRDRNAIASTIRGVPSEAILDVDDGMKGRCAVNLHNAVTVSQERLGRRVASLSAGRMHQICVALSFSLGCG
jgi:mRNA-degrading endonuclease toxin of MazEF toxin-antitoxin module